MRALRKKIEAEIEMAECASSSKKAADHLLKAIEMLEAEGVDQLDSELTYALGYAWYNLPDENKNRAEQAEKYLRSAVEKSSNNYYAILYLGHLCFDLARYTEALHQFLQIPGHYFASRAQPWRDLKVTELVLCCYLYMGNAREAVKTLERLVDESAKVDEIDRPKLAELDRAVELLLRNAKKQ